MINGNVYLFGDSVARGIILNEEGRYTPIKDYFGALAAEKLGIHLVNKAMFGCTITKGLEILRRFASNVPCASNVSSAPSTERPIESRPTSGIALLEFGGNDCDFLWNEVAEKPDAEHAPATPLESFSRKYAEMIDSLRSIGLRPAIMTLPPLVSERYLDWITRKGLDRRAILKWLGDVQQIFRWHEGYDAAVRTIAAVKACPLLDIRRAFLARSDYGDYMCEDGIHPNKAGHRLIESSLEAYAALA